jgi:5-oxoprolinase (ATP-hydrolysing) subunit A
MEATNQPAAHCFMKLSIDINCDMGEGYPYDGEIMPFITSANIACGYHAGDAAVIKKTIELAVKHNVAIGAHPSYPDRVHFGRRDMQLSDDELALVIKEQLLLFKNTAASFGKEIHHVKLHGALYNRAAVDERTARVIIGVIQGFDERMLVYGLSGSIFNHLAKKAGLRVAHEVFADRTYQSGPVLTPRSESDALIEDADAALEQVLRMLLEKRVSIGGGRFEEIQADTVCIHGDGKYAAFFARHLYRRLESNFIRVKCIT